MHDNNGCYGSIEAIEIVQEKGKTWTLAMVRERFKSQLDKVERHSDAKFTLVVLEKIHKFLSEGIDKVLVINCVNKTVYSKHKSDTDGDIFAKPSKNTGSIFPALNKIVVDDMFNSLVEARKAKISETLAKKAKEYASDKSRFHNFEEAARLSGETPHKELWGFLKKHIISVQDMVNNPQNVTKETVEEKIGDCINYLILLEGLFAVQRCENMAHRPEWWKNK